MCYYHNGMRYMDLEEELEIGIKITWIKKKLFISQSWNATSLFATIPTNESHIIIFLLRKQEYCYYFGRVTHN